MVERRSGIATRLGSELVRAAATAGIRMREGIQEETIPKASEAL
jgi:hypothetical protein